MDKAGNVATFVVSGISIDKTAPIVTGERSVEPNANGWNNTDVSVTFQATDALSGVESVSGDTTVTTEGANQSVTGQAVDKAGNVASLDVMVNLDKTVPNVTGHASPGATAMVWNNTDVDVSFEASDMTSGVDKIKGNALLTKNGFNQSVTGTAVDKAGNKASAVLTGINIDKTLPALTIEISGLASTPIGEPLDVLAVLGSFDGFSSAAPVFAVGTQFLDNHGNVISDSPVTLIIHRVVPSLKPGKGAFEIVWLTTCTYSPVSKQYYALFPATSLSDGIYELWFTTSTRQSVRARIALRKVQDK